MSIIETTAFTLSYNGYNTNIYDFIIFKRSGDLIEIICNLFQFTETTMVIFIKELYNYKHLHIIYLLSHLMTFNNKIYNILIYDSYYKSSFTNFTNNSHINALYYNIYKFNNLSIVNTLTKQKKQKRICYNNLNTILDVNKIDINELINIFNKILELYLQEIEKELNEIEMNVLSIYVIHTKLLPDLVKYVLIFN